MEGGKRGRKGPSSSGNAASPGLLTTNYSWAYSRRDGEREQMLSRCSLLARRKSTLNDTPHLVCTPHGLEYVVLVAVLSVFSAGCQPSGDHRLSCLVLSRPCLVCCSRRKRAQEWSSNLSKAAELAEVELSCEFGFLQSFSP